MTQKEFEERTKISTTAGEFEQVHDIYMACGDNMDKDEFCSLWKANNFRALLDKVTDEKKITEQAYGDVLSSINKLMSEQEKRDSSLADFLLVKACNHQDTDLHNEAIRLVGMKEVVIRKIRMRLPMWEEDIEYINKNLK